MPTDSTRATLVVMGADQSCAIYGEFAASLDLFPAILEIDQIFFRSLRRLYRYCSAERPDRRQSWWTWLDAHRTRSCRNGRKRSRPNQFAFSLFAQYRSSLTLPIPPVDNVHAYEPRGWSVLHGIEGWQNMCRGMIITNNQIGPAGHAPNTGFQFKKRDSTGNYGAGQWADGISIACFQSTVSNNVRPPSLTTSRSLLPRLSRCSRSRNEELIVGNCRLSSMRPMERLSALPAPRRSRTTPSSRAIDSCSVESTWSIGDRTSETTKEPSSLEIASSPRTTSSRSVSPSVECRGGTWTLLDVSRRAWIANKFLIFRSDNRTAARTFGGTVSNNVLSSGPGGYFGFGISRALSFSSLIPCANSVFRSRSRRS